MTQLLCEEFNVPSLIIANSAVLTTLASCRTTALVVDCGGGSTIVTPVVHCRSLAQAVISSPVAGEVLTDCLTRRLENNGQLLKIGRKATETITRGNLLVQSRKNCADSLKLHITMWKAMNFLMAGQLKLELNDSRSLKFLLAHPWFSLLEAQLQSHS
ncbi:SWI/SNF and RSC complexes subunit arp42-like isoform X4 [Malus sylvestris]|uniref:SWI/SNF and RSC complexes subunit arp42-like isoform X4 n=1 Tax=Malus sylvestris TaxID=3752 RepID=UPI0021AC62C6|nr:SWI/SNF and RSC complexes subunit arp42-like isoform X4 [Malus sylvestris]